MTAQPTPARKVSDLVHFTDLRNSERLVRAHGADVRHVQTWGAWYEWDDETGLWRKDDTGGVVRRMRDVVRSEIRDATEIADDRARAAKLKDALKMESARAVRDAISLAESHAGVATRHEDFDRDPWMLHALDATVDLRTGKARPHSRGDLCTKTSRVAWAPGAQCPRWIKFLDEIFLGRKDLVAFVRRAVGCSLTGVTADHAVYIAHGNGANGKTTFFNALAPVFGDYMTAVDSTTFLAKSKDDGRPRNDVARLVGARMAAASEIPEGHRLDEALVKSLTGGDRVTARFLHEEFFEFTPQFKVWLSTNHKPVIRGTDNGIWRRLKLLPFDATFPPEMRDQSLAATLSVEAPGILQWAAQGCAEWREDGLGSCGVVDDATKVYRSGQDVIGSFITDQCIVNGMMSAKGSRLYDAYRKWTSRNGEHCMRNRDFAAALEERGFAGRRTTSGKVWSGIDAKDGHPQDEDGDDLSLSPTQ